MTCKLMLTAPLCVIVVVSLGSPTVLAQQHTIYNTQMPKVIRVAIRENNNPRGKILWVQTLGFQEYCQDVLPNEWVPLWNDDALRSGAVAIKMFGWFHSLHPVTIDNYSFDVDNTVNFQHFVYQSGRPRTNKPIEELWSQAYVKPSGLIEELDYRAGIPRSPNWQYYQRDKMAQWGSQYWATSGWKYQGILRFYYQGRSMVPIPQQSL